MRQEVSGAEMVKDTKMEPSFFGRVFNLSRSSLFNLNLHLKRRNKEKI